MTVSTIEEDGAGTRQQAVADESRDLARATTRGTGWNFIGFSASKLAAFVATVILARLLAPTDFGLLALGLLVVRFLGRLSSFGIDAALIQRQRDPEAASNLAFYASLVLGLVMTVLGAMAATPLAGFFEEPEAVWIIRALCLSFTITALRTVPEARLRKALDFKRRMGPQIAGALFKGGVSVSLALLGFGVWSLIVGQLVGELVQMIGFWKQARWRPGPLQDLTLLRPMMTFGSKLLLLGLLVELINNLDYVVIGRLMTASELGLYTMAFRLPELVILSVCYVVSQAAFPAYSRLQGNPGALGRGFTTSVRWITLITLPAGVGMALVAAEFVRTFYGDQWAASVLPMQLLAIYTVLFSIPFNAGDVYKASNRTGLLLALELGRLALLAPALWFGALHHGINGVAMAHLSVMVVYSTATLAIASRTLHAAPRQLLRALRTPLLATAGMVAVVTPLLELLGEHSGLVRLLAASGAGAVAYVAVALLVDRQLIGEIKRGL